MKSVNSDEAGLAQRGAHSSLFRSFFLAGFECSTFSRRDGTRLDLVKATRHDEFCLADYARLQREGLLTAREGLRWHLIERTAGRHDFSSALPMLHASRDLGLQVLWDLCHYGWPNDLDPFSSMFVRRFEGLAAAFAHLVRDEAPSPHFFAPINEISFMSWAGAEVAEISPYARGRGFELKCQLVRSAIAAMEAIWSVLPNARFLQIDPIVNVVTNPARPWQAWDAESYRRAQYQAWDMLIGRVCPELGGDPKYLDIVGVNYYPHNQWEFGGRMLDMDDSRYRPLHEMLREVSERYGRPLLIAETGTEGPRRAPWLRYVGEQARLAMAAGVPITGLCLYPILNHPGWADDRHCYNGLWDYADDHGKRAICRSLAQELRRQRLLFAEQEDTLDARRICLSAA